MEDSSPNVKKEKTKRPVSTSNDTKPNSRGVFDERKQEPWLITATDNKSMEHSLSATFSIFPLSTASEMRILCCQPLCRILSMGLDLEHELYVLSCAHPAG